MKNPSITIYTDGACNPNPGPGGWAAVLIPDDGKVRELTGSAERTTSNRMELTAAIEALRSLPTPHRLHLYTDSEYLRRGITEWLPRWREREWQTSKRSEVKNRDLWMSLAQEIERHSVTWHWVKGHADDKWNERVDRLARASIPRSPLPVDDDEAIHVFTAAAYLPTTGHGGWGIVMRYRDRERESSGRANDTSANRMHLTAAIKGLQAITKPLPIHLYTTSDYLYRGATRWLGGWIERGWRTHNGQEVKNRDLWEHLAALIQERHPRWHLVTGRALPPEMARAKELAADAARGTDKSRQDLD